MKILAFGEVLLRLTVPEHLMLTQTDELRMSTVGTGVNLLSSLTHFGYRTRLLSRLPDNALGQRAAGELRRYGIQDDYVTFGGQHMGAYFVELGYGSRPERVTYQDRLSSAFCQQPPDDQEIAAALVGCQFVHICGITLSLTAPVRQAALRLAQQAHANGQRVCFDFNYRQQLNTGVAHETLKARYQEILPYVDIVFGSKRDLTALLDYPDDEDRTQSANRESESALYEQFVRDYHIDYFAGSYRYQIGQQKWFAGFSYQHQQLVVGKARPLMILDRIGSGDAFASGIITGLIEGWSLQKTTDFAIATAILAQATVNDAPEFTKEMVLADMASDGQLELIR